MKKSILIAVMVVTANFSCRNNGTEAPSSDFQIIAEDVGVTEVWLRVKFTQSSEPLTLIITRDGHEFHTSQYSLLDTIILSDFLLPKHTYEYTATLTGRKNLLTSFTRLTVTTMDTTSHDFKWEIDTLGEGAGSVLNDVVIVNDTCVWAVGEISVKDSMGNFVTPPYNYAMWNGSHWILRTSFEQGYLYGALSTVWAFSPNDVWVGSTIPEHWDGTRWTFYGTARGFPTSFYITKIWGTSSSDLYVVGTSGSIVHFDGTRWSEMESGTDVNLTDIWGTPDGKELWACGFREQDGASTIIRRRADNPSTWQRLWDSRISMPPYLYQGFMSTLWSAGRSEFLITSGILFRHSFLNPSILRVERVVTANGWHLFNFKNFPYRLRGTASNNVIAVGDDARIWHFNGQNWYSYEELLNSNDRLYGLFVSERMMVGVGTRYGAGPFRSALVITGKRR